MLTKICKKCGKRKPLSEFHYASTNKDRLRNQCKDCQKEYHKLYRSGKNQPREETTITYQDTILEPYEFQNGFSLKFIDLADNGVKIELTHQDEDYAVRLPNEEIPSAAEWLTEAQNKRKKAIQINARRRNAVLTR